MKLIGIIAAIGCLTMVDAAQAACRTSADAYRLQRDARVLGYGDYPELDRLSGPC
jgi:hypothetical protein